MLRRSRMTRTSRFVAVILATIATGVVAGLGAAGILNRETTITTPPVLVEPVGAASAFSGEPTAQERLHAQQADVQRGIESVSAPAGESVPDEFLPGDRVGPVRVPLAGLGEAGRTIWMYQTTRGKVCYGLTRFTAGCLDRLPLGQVVNPTVGDPGDGGGPIVWGFARDNVRAVKAIVDGETHRATLGRNVFFYQAKSSASRITGVVAETSNGATVTFTLEQAPASAAAASALTRPSARVTR